MYSVPISLRVTLLERETAYFFKQEMFPVAGNIFKTIQLLWVVIYYRNFSVSFPKVFSEHLLFQLDVLNEAIYLKVSLVSFV